MRQRVLRLGKPKDTEGQGRTVIVGCFVFGSARYRPPTLKVVYPFLSDAGRPSNNVLVGGESSFSPFFPFSERRTKTKRIYLTNGLKETSISLQGTLSTIKVCKCVTRLRPRRPSVNEKVQGRETSTKTGTWR